MQHARVGKHATSHCYPYTLVTELPASRCAGYNLHGQLGDNSTTNRPAPTIVVGNSTWTALPSHGWAYGYTCAIKTNASLWCWVSWLKRQSWWPERHAGGKLTQSVSPAAQGYNLVGNVGDGTILSKLAGPVQVAGGGSWLSVETGYSHTCGIQVDRRLYCWVRGGGWA